MPDTYEFAHCFRSGEIEFSRKPFKRGLILVDEGPSQVVRARICALARKGYEEGVWLVPGIPEADTDDQAEDALYRFHRQVAQRKMYPHG